MVWVIFIPMITRTTMSDSSIFRMGLTDSVFYEPTDNGKEKEIAQWLHWLKENDE